MKRTIAVAAFLSALGLACARDNAIAQEYEGCFLIDPAGNRIDLGDLCPSNPPPTATEPTSTPSPEAGRTAANVVQVPIVRRLSGIPVVNVTFNGRQTFEMLLDTGASNTVITQSMARELQVARAGNIQIDTASQRNVTAEVGYIPAMELGGIVSRNVPVTIAPPDLDIGLLGQDFFGQYDLTVRENVVEFAFR